MAKSKEELGIKAIIGLQELAGITETEESARIGWNSLSKFDQENTLRIAIIFGVIEEEDVNSSN